MNTSQERAERTKETLFSSIRNRLKNRTDTEHEQAIIRILLTCVFFALFYLLSSPTIVVLTSIYLIISILILVWIIIVPPPSHMRKVIGIIGDMAMTSSVLYIAGEAGALSLTVYLWVITGNGFRYGIRYLKISAFIAIAGACIALSISTYWYQHVWFGSVFLITLIAIPLYMAKLLRQLRLAIDTAEHANKAKSQFLANMSHELRTPLNGIIGASDLLTVTPLNQKQQKYTQIIQSSGHTLLSLIEDVLDISKIEAGKQTIESIPFDLHVLITTTTQVFQPQAEEKNIILSSYVSPDVPFLLKGDELHIKQVLMNFISNALKFTEKGSVQLVVTKLDQSSNGIVWVHFKVIDTGIGLSKAAQENIFESFVQADSSVTRKYGGTGLGTTISKELLALMGGEIGLNSQEGKGSEFWFQLPLERQEVQPKEDIAASTSFADARILTLLNEDTQTEFLPPLNRWGQDITSSVNLVDLITELSDADKLDSPFQIAIVEKSLLGMTPKQFIETVRKKIKVPSTSFVLVGDYFDHTSTQELINLGFAAALTIPLNESLLFNAIHEVCIGKQLNTGIPSIAEYQQKKNQSPSLHILVAEDNEVNQVVIREFLENMGHQVFMTEDGEEALDALSDESQKFDMALLDINMPNMSGMDVLKAYRFLETGERLPVAILSADATSTNIKECLDAGADDYLTKPVEHQKLADTIETLTRSHAHNNKAKEATPKPLKATGEWVHINVETLDKLSSMTARERFIETLIEKFLKGTAKKIDDLNQAALEHNTQAFTDIIHTLKGSAGMIGATTIYQTCRAIEQHNLTPEVMRHNIETLKEAFDRSNLELTHYIQMRGS